MGTDRQSLNKINEKFLAKKPSILLFRNPLLNFPPNMAKTIEESLSLATKSKIIYYDLETTNLMQRTKSEGAEYNRKSLLKQFSTSSSKIEFLNQYKNNRYW